MEVDGTPVAEVGPGAILGEMALLHEGRRTATLRAVTPCRVAVVPKDRIDRQALEELVKGRVPRIDRQTLEEIAKSPHPARQLSGSLAQPPSSSSRRPRKRRCGSWRTRSRARR